MDRNTNLRDMDAPAVNSGKYAGDTILAAKGAEKTSSESGPNAQKQYVTESQPKGSLGGQSKFK
jgi:hypothetical protein